MRPDFIRNFCIVAHIDHGKSTLADRLLERTGTFSAREMKDQILDSMDLERERGITIKAHAVAMHYVGADGTPYRYHLIDTPGHVDFSYEVSRSLAACEGALVLVDAAQGVEAQTVSNLLMAMENDLSIIPVVNKIDLPSARTDAVAVDLARLVGVPPQRVIRASARRGDGIDELLEAIHTRIPAPAGKADAPLRALVFDSEYDRFRGVVAFVRIVDGQIAPGARIRLGASGRQFEALEVGVLRLRRIPRDRLVAGEVGYVIAGVKNVHELRVGDTIIPADRPEVRPLPGYRPMKPMVFCGIYPVDSADYVALREALSKLTLNDASLVFEPETSAALGFGFRCGFLGPLHNEIVMERLRREYDLELIATVSNVAYRVLRPGGEVLEVQNPAAMPPHQRDAGVEEPFVTAQIVAPADAIGAVTKLCQERRGIHRGLEYLEATRALLSYDLPLAEIITDFHDRLKSVSRGYASLDYELAGYRRADLVRCDVLLNAEPVDAFCAIVHRDAAQRWGREISERLKDLIPRQLFQVAVQVAVGGRVIARSTIPAMRKNVTAKCYGGDITRKRKLLERQKEGKKRMKQVGKVHIPQEAFLAILRRGD